MERSAEPRSKTTCYTIYWILIQKTLKSCAWKIISVTHIQVSYHILFIAIKSSMLSYFVKLNTTLMAVAFCVTFGYIDQFKSKLFISIAKKQIFFIVIPNQKHHIFALKY